MYWIRSIVGASAIGDLPAFGITTVVPFSVFTSTSAEAYHLPSLARTASFGVSFKSTGALPVEISTLEASLPSLSVPVLFNVNVPLPSFAVADTPSLPAAFFTIIAPSLAGVTSAFGTGFALAFGCFVTGSMSDSL